MRLTIIPDDGPIVVDGHTYTEINFSEKGINSPADVHALQWYGEEGEIEYKERTKPNKEITKLPAWANAAASAHADLLHEEQNPPPLPDLTDAEILDSVIELRADFLSSTDWTVLPDSPFTDAERESWVSYRQNLRDITDTAGYPWNGVYSYDNWPTPPTAGVVNEPTLNTAPREWFV